MSARLQTRRWAVAIALLALVGTARATPERWSTPSPYPEGSRVEVRCEVFLDRNEDGERQPDEPALPGVAITNGVDFFETAASGRVRVSVDLAVYRFATLEIPPGYWPTTPWYRRLSPQDGRGTLVPFGLKRLPATAEGPIRWVHISDTQTRSWDEVPAVEEDLEAVNALADPPLFLVNTGDLVEVGSDSTHWNHYLAQLRTSEAPVFSVPGNHDVVQTDSPLEEYERFVGPPYYNLRAGRWNFLFVNSENTFDATPRQGEWLENVVTRCPAETRHVTFQHRLLASLKPEQIESLAALGIQANFSGHWHGLQIARHASGIVDFNLSRTAMGPLDRTPRAFAVVTFTADGEIEYELRRLAVDHRVAITHPGSGQKVAGDALELLVQAYDTSSPVERVRVELVGRNGAKSLADLSPEGVSLWRAVIDARELPTGLYDGFAVAQFADGRTVARSVSFERVEVEPIRRSPHGEWPMFRSCAAGSSFTETSVDPPLDLAWTAPVPGMVGLSSPVVSRGRVFLGSRVESGRLEDAGILCCDAASGAIEWFRSIPGGVALAPAVAEGVVLVSSMTDSVFGLDAATGRILWTADSPGGVYKVTAPIFEGDEAWFGSEPRPVSLDWRTGELRWTSARLGEIWHPGIYSAPAVGPDYVYFGFYGTPGLELDGFSVVDRRTGALVEHFNGSYRSAIWSNGTLYVAGDRNFHRQVLTARDPRGNVLWASTEILGYGTGSPALGRGVIAIPGRQGRIQGFRAENGELLWTHRTDPALLDMSPNRRDQRDAISTPAIADSVVYVGSLDGNLYALDLIDGTELWRHDFGVPVASSPAASGNMIFVGASDGHLYAFVESSARAPAGSFADLGVEPGPVGHFAFYPPKPNPSVGGVRFEWVMPSAAHVRLSVYDLGGRLVRTVLEETRAAGEQFARWDGRSSEGAFLPAGIYWARLEAGERRSVRKLVRLRR